MMAQIDFELPKKMNISKETLNLLMAMLEINPENRISSKQALSHPCFHTMLSVSPLISRPFDPKNILDHA